MLRQCLLALNRTSGQLCQCRVWEPISASVNLQCVRWRKMRTDPRPKHKILIKRRPVPNEWEDPFLKTRYNQYRTQMNAVRAIIVKQVEEVAARNEVILLTKKLEEEFPGLLEWNEQENQKTRILREQRLAAQAIIAEEEKLAQMLKEEEKRIKHLEYVEELVQKEKEASKSFIVYENIDEKIAEAIDNPKNYNFSMTRDGQIQLPEDTSWEKLQAKQEETQRESASAES